MTTPDPSHVPEQIRIIVAPGQSKERLDVFLSHQLEQTSRSKVQQHILAGLVLVNGKSVKASYQVQPSDSISVTVIRPPKAEAEAENIPLDIIYEDDSVLVVNKPAGMVAHPAYGHHSGTLVNALLYHSGSLSTVNASSRPGIVHRLDKDTTGLLLVAKNNSAHHRLAAQFAKHSIEREYWALVWGVFKKKYGTIETKLGRSKNDRKKVTVTSEGKHALTKYTVMKQYDFLALVKLNLHTGRTHQIRVHLAHIGHPVFGDPTYGGRNSSLSGLRGKKEQNASNLLSLISRQALHAKTIGFVHPDSNELLRFDSELPADMREVLDSL